MLVLSRKLKQRIRIQTPDGQTIWVVVLDSYSGKTRIGIDAPRDFVIAREELLGGGDEAVHST